MIVGVIIQQPDEVLDYDIDCTPAFKGSVTDTVDSVSVSIDPVGLIVLANKLDDNTVKLWISNGTAGVDYNVEVNVVTTEGRTKQDELLVKVLEF